MSHIKSVLRPVTLDIDDDTQQYTIKSLNKHLADMLALALSTKQAHWNMRGENFISVHQMLDPFNEKLLEDADTIAERIVQLGGVALGTPEVIATDMSFKNYPTDIARVEEHLTELLNRYGSLANMIRDTVDEEKCDAGTLDLLTGIVEDLDKYTWFISSVLGK